MILKIAIVASLCIVQASITSATGTGNMTQTYFLTSCTVFPPLLGSCTFTAALPNLAYGKATEDFDVIWSCNNLLNLNSPLNPNVTWSYYANGPQGCGTNECCYNTTTSQFSFPTVVWTTDAGQTFGAGIGGCVTSGTFSGYSASVPIVIPVLNSTQCSSNVGVVARFGTFAITITNGLLPLFRESLVCTGVIDQMYCPGLH